ncbi:LysR family transcriptional regulator [Pseudomonas putida S11]|nr:LysR family transcriptional regulator [Pseudomonas putida S11]
MGVADVVPKSIVYRLLAPTMELDDVLRINCREDKLERLLADLAIQRLDLVISDSPMPSHLDIKGYSQKLGECGLSFFATPALAHRLEGPFPACLQDAPLLIPGQETVVRSRLLRWLGEQQVQPRIVGEFDDSALMQAFGQSGQRHLRRAQRDRRGGVPPIWRGADRADRGGARVVLCHFGRAQGQAPGDRGDYRGGATRVVSLVAGRFDASRVSMVICPPVSGALRRRAQGETGSRCVVLPTTSPALPPQR